MPGSPRPQPGEMVIRALVRARLLGLKILTLEAQVVVGTSDGHPVVTAPVIDAAPEPAALGSRPYRPGPPTSGPAPGFARATELLEQSAEALERSRRVR